MLYYTGITRAAKKILQEIVRGMFLNSRSHQTILLEMLEHSRGTFDALNRGDWNGFNERVRKSWELNQRLDSGTNPESVQSILAPVDDYLSACKLLGAGGGGYLFMIAKDPEATAMIRHTINNNPPNNRGRFVDFAISENGLKVTRS